ncbi:hypothetical protein PYCC9005_000510 [Savitreella phatthalungensis]
MSILTEHTGRLVDGTIVELDAELAAEEALLAEERQWLIREVLPRSLDSLVNGLEECRVLLRCAAVTLPLSTRETECLKGIATRKGARLKKGSIVVRVRRLHMRVSLGRADTSQRRTINGHSKSEEKEVADDSDTEEAHDDSPGDFCLPQVAFVRDSVDGARALLLNHREHLVEMSSEEVEDRVETLLRHLRGAQQALEGSDDPSEMTLPAAAASTASKEFRSAAKSALARRVGNRFPVDTRPADAFFPVLPDNVCVDVFVRESALAVEVVLLQERGSRAEPGSAGLLDRMMASAPVAALPRGPNREDPLLGEFVRYRGKDVRILDRVRVVSQDPALVACGAKLTSLLHAAEQIRDKLQSTSTVSNDR